MSAPPPNDAVSKRVFPHDDSPRVGVIANPRSHRNKGKEQLRDRGANVRVAIPSDHDRLVDELARFKADAIDLLVISGGDGTVRDVLSAGLDVFGGDWPLVAVLPKGKTNALTVDLGVPSPWTLEEAIAAYRNGRRIARRPLAIVPLDGPGDTMLGFIFGAGAFTRGIDKGQDAHRWGAFDSFAVAITTIWGLFGALFGSRNNAWRRGAEMEILIGPDRTPLPHSGEGDPARRVILLASTLERFPVGIKPFGDFASGLKIGVLDQVKRRTMWRLPLVLTGSNFKDMDRRGFFQRVVPSFELKLDDEFILDGEAYPGGTLLVKPGPEIAFVAP